MASLDPDHLNPDSILIIRYSALGDVMLATSVLAPLRERFPNAQIEWLSRKLYLPLLKGISGLDQVHALEDFQHFKRFDWVIDLQNKLRTRLISLRAAPRRLYFRKRSITESIAAAFGHDPPLQRAHATTLFANVLAPLGISSPGPLQIAIQPEAQATASVLLRAACRPLIALAPGAGWATKRWAIERFAAVGNQLVDQGADLVLVGGPVDSGLLSELQRLLKRPALVNLSRQPLSVMAAVLAEVDLLLASDSGPVHIATALKTKTLVLFGPTSPIRWGPPTPSQSLALGLSCSPCSNHGTAKCPLGHHRCLTDLSEQEVFQRLRGMLPLKFS